MTVPRQYVRAQRQFDAFMTDAMRELDQDTTHRAYHTVAGVLRAFRRRVSVQEALGFADTLPAILRAIFVSEWDVSEERKSFRPADAVLDDVRSFQRHHNFAPDNAIEAVARALRRHVDQIEFEAMLRRLPEDAGRFWAVER